MLSRVSSIPLAEFRFESIFTYIYYAFKAFKETWLVPYPPLIFNSAEPPIAIGETPGYTDFTNC